MLVMKGKTFISKFATKKGNSSSKLASTAFKFYQKHKYSPSTKTQNASPEKFPPPKKKIATLPQNLAALPPPIDNDVPLPYF